MTMTQYACLLESVLDLVVVKGFFFTRKIILLSSTTVVFRVLPGLLVLLSSDQNVMLKVPMLNY